MAGMRLSESRPEFIWDVLNTGRMNWIRNLPFCAIYSRGIGAKSHDPVRIVRESIRARSLATSQAKIIKTEFPRRSDGMLQ